MGSMINLDFQNRGYVAQKAVQAGFQSIMFVDHVNADQVRESVSFVKPKLPGTPGVFGYPNGRYIGGQSHIPALDHAGRLNDIVLCFMIEKQEAVDQIDEICSVPGVDTIQFGPNDYCLSKGWNREMIILQKQKKRRDAALRQHYDTVCGQECEIGTPEAAEYYLSLGVKDFSLGDQLKTLKRFWNSAGKDLRRLAEEKTQ